MNLQSKAILSITTVFIALVIILTIILKTLLLGGFLTLESATVNDNVHRVQNLMRQEKENLIRLVSDWAIWDDAYAFVKNRNQQFITSNLEAPTYEANNIDVILLMNRRGKVVFGKEYNDDSEALDAINPELLQQFTVNSRFMQMHQEEDIVSGLLSTSGVTYLIAVSPVLKSDNSGISPGIMLMAKRVDKDFVARLKNVLKLDLHMYGNRQLIGEGRQALIQSLESQGGVYEKVVDDKRVFGYGLDRDVFGKPALLYEVNMARDIYQQGLSTNRYLIAATLLMAIVISILIAVLIRKLVVNKIAFITQRLKSLDKHDDRAGLLKNLGHDEIGNLSQTINELLDNFKRTETDLGNAREMSERIRRRRNFSPSSAMSCVHR